MEALRIIAMSMILIHHFMIHGLTSDNIPNNLYHGLNSFVYCGVTVFFLLSGYFTIRYSFKGLLKLILTILFFGLLNLIFLILVGETPEPKRWIIALAFPITRSPYWFMKIYLLLYITAPILNAGLHHLGRNRLRNALLILIFVLFYGVSHLADSNYLHGMYLYCTGYYIGKFNPCKNVSKGMWLLAFFIFTCLSNCLDWSLAYLGYTTTYFTSYRNFLIFLGGIMLLMYFRKLDFKSPAINSIASASLGCYLLQDGFFGYKWLYKLQGNMLMEYGYGLKLFVIFIGLFVAFWVSSWLLTQFTSLWLPSAATRLNTLIHSSIRRIRLIKSRLG